VEGRVLEVQGLARLAHAFLPRAQAAEAFFIARNNEEEEEEEKATVVSGSGRGGAKKRASERDVTQHSDATHARALLTVQASLPIFITPFRLLYEFVLGAAVLPSLSLSLFRRS
jgi:hypothetical protein